MAISDLQQQASQSSWPNSQGFETWFEQPHPVDLQVTGTIPAYAAGTLYRTGPGGYKTETARRTTFATSHWFDGFSQVHRFQILPNRDSPFSTKVIYNSRHTVDKYIEDIKKTGKLSGITFGQKRDPCETYFKKLMTVFQSLTSGTGGPVKDPSSANVGVTLSVNMPGLTPPQSGVGKANGHSSGINTLYTKTDANVLQQIDPETLEPIGIARQQNLHPSLKGPLSGAHSKTDPITGNVYNFNLDFGRVGTYRVFEVSAATGKTKILATIPGTPAYIHSLFLTEDHVVLCVWNSHIAKGGAQILWNQNMLDAMAPFSADKPATWYVVDRKHDKGLLATYESPPFFCFHTINAWTEPSATNPSLVDIVAELTLYDNLDVLKSFYYENLVGLGSTEKSDASEKGHSHRGSLHRFRLPAVLNTPTKAVKRVEIEFKVPKEASPELPTMNPAFFTRAHRYTYGIADRGLSTFADGIVKFDSVSKQPTYWSTQGHSPGEPIFIADPDGRDEDDGVLLSVVLDGFAGKSYLLCLDAKTMTEKGRAQVEGVVGFGFHGCHVSSRGITSQAD